MDDAGGPTEDAGVTLCSLSLLEGLMGRLTRLSTDCLLGPAAAALGATSFLPRLGLLSAEGVWSLLATSPTLTTLSLASLVVLLWGPEEGRLGVQTPDNKLVPGFLSPPVVGLFKPNPSLLAGGFMAASCSEPEEGPVLSPCCISVPLGMWRGREAEEPDWRVWPATSRDLGWATKCRFATPSLPFLCSLGSLSTSPDPSPSPPLPEAILLSRLDGRCSPERALLEGVLRPLPRILSLLPEGLSLAVATSGASPLLAEEEEEREGGGGSLCLLERACNLLKPPPTPFTLEGGVADSASSAVVEPPGLMRRVSLLPACPNEKEPCFVSLLARACL